MPSSPAILRPRSSELSAWRTTEQVYAVRDRLHTRVLKRVRVDVNNEMYSPLAPPVVHAVSDHVVQLEHVTLTDVRNGRRLVPVVDCGIGLDVGVRADGPMDAVRKIQDR